MTRLLDRLALDLPRSGAEWSDRIGRALQRHETWLSAALLVGTCVEIWIGVARTAALYHGGP